jgi:hypothetical protein
MPPVLKDRIEQCARNNGRSMNSEIVARLERTFAEDERQALTAAVKASGDATQELLAGGVLPGSRPMQKRLSELYDEAEKRLLEEMKAQSFKTFADAAARHKAKRKA